MAAYKGYGGVLLDLIKCERLVLLLPMVFVNFFSVGYVLHGVLFEFGELSFSQILVCVNISIILFFGELVLLLVPVKVWVDRHLIPGLRRERDILRLGFDEQDIEIFRRVKTASNSLILIGTGLMNYLMIAYFALLWYSNNGQPLAPRIVVESLIPFYGFLVFLNFLAFGYDLVKGRSE
jgi:hypothetical protein